MPDCSPLVSVEDRDFLVVSGAKTLCDFRVVGDVMIFRSKLFAVRESTLEGREKHYQ